MSDQRRFTWRSGLLISTPLSDFWQASLTVQDPAIPNLPVETAAAGGAANIIGAGQIASTEAIGPASASAGIAGAGIVSGEALGQPMVTAESAHNIVDVGGIATGNAIGSHAVSAAIAAVGIASTEAIGNTILSATIAAVAVDTAESHGQPSLVVDVAAAGIASGEALGGALDVSAILEIPSIVYGESFGNPVLAVTIAAVAIASSEAIGQPTISDPGAAWEISGSGGIASSEAIGSPEIYPFTFLQIIDGGGGGGMHVSRRRSVVAPLPHGIACLGIPSAEAFGQPIVAPGMRARRIREQEYLLRRAA